MLEKELQMTNHIMAR